MRESRVFNWLLALELVALGVALESSFSLQNLVKVGQIVQNFCIVSLAVVLVLDHGLNCRGLSLSSFPLKFRQVEVFVEKLGVHVSLDIDLSCLKG